MYYGRRLVFEPSGLLFYQIDIFVEVITDYKTLTTFYVGNCFIIPKKQTQKKYYFSEPNKLELNKLNTYRGYSNPSIDINEQYNNYLKNVFISNY